MNRWYQDNKERIAGLFPVIGLMCLFLLFSVTAGDKFLSPFNLSNIVNQACIIMVTGIGVCFIMSHNNLDLSCGGAMALCGVITYLMCEKISFIFLIPGCIIVGMLIGFLTGCIHVYGRIPAFLAGFAMMSLGRGISVISVDHKMRTPGIYKSLNTVGFYIGVLLVVSIIAIFVMKYTRIGKYNKLIGVNPITAEMSGINVNRYKLIAFMINGITIGIATFLTLIRAGAITNTTGNGVETNTLIAVVIGGMPLAGGSKSKIGAAIVGALIFTVLQNGLIIWQMNADWINVIKGIVFLIIVILTVDRKHMTLTA